jgi:hypothetical protein
MEQERKIDLADIIPESELESYTNYLDKDHLDYISYHYHLSQEFIEKHSDKVNWCNISAYQKLSEEFIKKHINKIHIDQLMNYNNNVSYKIKKEIKTLKEII